MTQQTQYLLLEDVDGLGRGGDLVFQTKVKPGFARNYLLPKRKITIASKHTVRLQEQLRQERQKQAEKDLKEAQELSQLLTGRTFEVHRKVDQEGHMYGSISAQDIVNLLAENGFKIERRFVRIPGSIKSLGVHTIPLKLKENVECYFTLKVLKEEELLQE